MEISKVNDAKQSIMRIESRMKTAASGDERDSKKKEAFPIYVFRGKNKHRYNPDGSVDSFNDSDQSSSRRKLQYLLVSKKVEGTPNKMRVGRQSASPCEIVIKGNHR